MARFLSDEWLASLDRSARGASVPTDLRLAVQQIVVDETGGETAFVLRIADGAASIESGRADDVEVVFTQDRATAAAIGRGELSAQAAFMAGRIKVGGDLRVVIDRARELQAIDDIFADARADTSW